MANIKQQKKRVRIAARQRLENLRYRSTIKTLTKRLERCGAGRRQADEVATEHRELVRLIDRAASRGALHRNTAARKKAQAARLVSGAAPRRPRRGRRGRPRDVDERALELEIAGETRAALERVVELGEPDGRVAQLVVREASRLRGRASARSTGAASAATRPRSSSALGEQALALLDAREVARERTDESRRDVPAR